MSASTITPSAIDGHLRIESIWVAGRHRKDLGNLQSLADSIADVGLLNPITVTIDNRLIAGQRRLEALRLLGEGAIPVRFVRNLDEAAQLLRAERDENVERKEMLPSEKASLGEALYAIEEQAARERQRAAGREHGRGIARGDISTSYSPEAGSATPAGSEESKTRHLVGEALGMSGRTYSDLRYVFKAANDPELPEGERVLAMAALDRMDRSGTVGRTAKEFRALQRARRDAQDAKASALAAPVAPDELDPLPPAPAEEPEELPAGRVRRSPLETTKRFERMRELAASGHTSEQIAAILDYSSASGARTAAREQGIDIPADAVMGRSQHRIDSNRIIRETVQTLESLDIGLKLVNFDQLDPAEIGSWTNSLSESIRVLNRLNKRLKEKVQ